MRQRWRNPQWRWSVLAARGIGWRLLRAKLIDAPLEPILHPTPGRLMGFGLFALVGHPLFGWAWHTWLPQPWESPALRAVMAAMGLPLILGLGMADVTSRRARVLFSLICWLQLPLFFSWMYLCNGGNTVWLASAAAMVLVYYHATDWRLATLGTISGGLVAEGLFRAFGPAIPAMPHTAPEVNAMVIGFAWTAGLALGLSSANLRREHLRHTLATVGIMAHELRTPLATIALVGDVMQREAAGHTDEEAATRLGQLSARLHALVRGMNHQIDVQIFNARLLNLPPQRETVAAAHAVQEAVDHYPFRTTRERESVRVLVRRDFRFRASSLLFSHVIDNLVKNALKSLAATPVPARPGDITLEVGVLHNRGRILVSDVGVGISPELAPRIFEPFFSTDASGGHGLGLAFCRRVLTDLGGSIHVTSVHGKGATFIIELPLLSHEARTWEHTE